MIAIQRRHCVPDEADVLVTDTFQRAELAKGFGTKRAEVQICQINPIETPVSYQREFPLPDDSRLLRVREIVSTHVATEALPFDRVPPSIAIPDCVFVKRQNTGRIGWYCCHDIKPSSRSCP
jgi:hypothetical protein